MSKIKILVVTTAVFIIIWFSSVTGQKLTVLSPKAGDTLYLTDTVRFHFEADEEIKESGVGVEIFFSPDKGKNVFPLYPLESVLETWLIPLKESWAYTPSFILPDTFYIKSGEDSIKVSATTDKGIFMVQPYGVKSLRASSNCCVTVLPTRGSNISRFFFSDVKPISTANTKRIYRVIDAIENPYLVSKNVIFKFDCYGRLLHNISAGNGRGCTPGMRIIIITSKL